MLRELKIQQTQACLLRADLFCFSVECPRLQVQPFHCLDRCYFSSAPLTDNSFKLREVDWLATFVDPVHLCDCYSLSKCIIRSVCATDTDTKRQASRPFSHYSQIQKPSTEKTDLRLILLTLKFTLTGLNCKQKLLNLIESIPIFI